MKCAEIKHWYKFLFKKSYIKWIDFSNNIWDIVYQVTAKHWRQMIKQYAFGIQWIKPFLGASVECALKKWK